MSTATRIRWEPTQYGGFTGHVGTVETWLFQMYKPMLAGQGWVLTATFPGAFDDVRPGTPESLKAEAERWLEEFVASLGAVFPDEPAKQRKSRAWHADWAEAGRDRDGNAILKHKPTGGRYKILPIEEC